jgi:hypothetical protein
VRRRQETAEVMDVWPALDEVRCCFMHVCGGHKGFSECHGWNDGKNGGKQCLYLESG